MRIISCPECGEDIELEPGDEGRKIRCPECNERFVIFNRSHRDEQDERPRKRKKRHKSGPNWAVIGGIAAGVLVLAVGGAVAYLASRPKTDMAKIKNETPANSHPQPGPTPAIPGGMGQPHEQTPVLPPPPMPKGWIKVTANEAGLSAYWPGKPDSHGESESDMGGRSVLKVENRGLFVCITGPRRRIWARHHDSASREDVVERGGKGAIPAAPSASGRAAGQRPRHGRAAQRPWVEHRQRSSSSPLPTSRVCTATVSSRPGIGCYS